MWNSPEKQDTKMLLNSTSFCRKYALKINKTIIEFLKGKKIKRNSNQKNLKSHQQLNRTSVKIPEQTFFQKIT